jgi:hypothetical protein
VNSNRYPENRSNFQRRPHTFSATSASSVANSH